MPWPSHGCSKRGAKDGPTMGFGLEPERLKPERKVQLIESFSISGGELADVEPAFIRFRQGVSRRVGLLLGCQCTGEMKILCGRGHEQGILEISHRLFPLAGGESHHAARVEQVGERAHLDDGAVDQCFGLDRSLRLREIKSEVVRHDGSLLRSEVVALKNLAIICDHFRLEVLQAAAAEAGAWVVQQRVPSLEEIFVARVGRTCPVSDEE